MACVEANGCFVGGDNHELDFFNGSSRLAQQAPDQSCCQTSSPRLGADIHPPKKALMSRFQSLLPSEGANPQDSTIIRAASQHYILLHPLREPGQWSFRFFLPRGAKCLGVVSKTFETQLTKDFGIRRAEPAKQELIHFSSVSQLLSGSNAVATGAPAQDGGLDACDSRSI
jgi:hypothetical protein